MFASLDPGSYRVILASLAFWIAKINVITCSGSILL